MMRRLIHHIWRKVWLRGALLLAAAVLLLAGCRTVHPRTDMGTGTYSYLSRHLAWTYPYTLDEIWAATLAIGWNIRPALSSGSMRESRSSTRCSTGSVASWYGKRADEADMINLSEAGAGSLT